MRKIGIVALLLVAPLVVHGGVKRDVPWKPNEFTIASAYRNGALSNGTSVAGFTVGNNGVRVVRVALHVTVQSGGGAGNTVLTITDGTNTCTATFACTSTQGTAPFMVSVATANGAGTGCNYAARANLLVSVTTAGCTTTQPSVGLASFLGLYP